MKTELEIVYEDKVIAIDEVAITVDRNYQRIIESDSLFLYWTEIAFPQEFPTYETEKRAVGSLEEAIKTQSGNVSAQAALATRAREIRERVNKTEASWKNRLLSFLATLEEEVQHREDQIPKKVNEETFQSISDAGKQYSDLSDSSDISSDSAISLLRSSPSWNPNRELSAENQETRPVINQVSASTQYLPTRPATPEELSPGEVFLGTSWREQDAETIWKAIINAELIGGAVTILDISVKTGIPSAEVAKVQSNAAFGYYKIAAQNVLPQFGVETQRGREIALRQRHSSLMRIVFERQIAASSPEEISDVEIIRLGLSPQMRDPLLRLMPGARTGYLWYKVTTLRITSNSEVQMRGQRTQEHRDYFFDHALQNELRSIEKQLEAYETNTILNVASGKKPSGKKKYNFDVNALIKANTPVE